jgi:inner membrane protein
MMPPIPWWAWTILAGVVGLAELHLPGSYLIWIALGAALTAAADAIWWLSLSAQIGTFAAASAVSCLIGYFVYRRLNHPIDARVPLNQRDLQMIGAQGVVCAPIAHGRGKVQLGDSVWLAEGPDLPEGSAIVVKSVRGSRVIVAPADSYADVPLGAANHANS